MESIRELKEALSARAETRSLEELQSGGRRRVRVIRAENIGAMIDEAVQRAVAESCLVSREEADRLVERSRQEFAAVHAERQRESEELTALRRDSDQAERRLAAFGQQVASLEEDVEQLEREREEARSRAAEAEQALEAAQRQVDELQRALDEAQRRASDLERTMQRAGTASSQGGGMPPELMMKMMEELASLKARVEFGGAAVAAPAAPAAAPPPAAPADALSQALEKLTSSMNDRLEQMGRKMGISGAVEADSVNLDGLFADLDEQKFESNLDSLEVKQRQSGGIAANLARLKKLKGGD
jgi:hypothetical protein